MANKLQLPPPPTVVPVDQPAWRMWFELLYALINPTEPVKMPGYAVADVPSAADWAKNTQPGAFTGLIYVYDETGGAVPAFSDGTNWRRVTDRTIIA